MSHLTIKDLDLFIATVEAGEERYGADYIYAEVGRYKPWHPSIRKAAERRGYRVEKVGMSAYRIYPKEKQ